MEKVINEKFSQTSISDVDSIVEKIGTSANKVIPILQALQEFYKYLPKSALQRVCEITDITPAAIMGVSTFYSQFRHKPVGEHVIQICNGTACHVKGSEQVFDSFFRELKLKKGEDTDADGQFTVQKVACLGCCTLAPVVQIDHTTYGHVTPESVNKVIEDFLTRDFSLQPPTYVHKDFDDDIGEIRIGLGSCCVASGSADVHQALEKSLIETGIHTHIKRVGCVGMCHRVPLLEVVPPKGNAILYDRVKPDQVKNIIRRHFKAKDKRKNIYNRVTKWLEDFYSQNTKDIEKYPINVRDPIVESFLGRQIHIATQHAGNSDPLALSEYRTRGGFAAVEECISKRTPEDVIDIIKSSGLRGRGGAGFPTGEKWHITQKSVRGEKYIICNGDEGDPGAFMDRMILESYPFRVIEGMIIGAYAVGAQKGFLYIRAEYPLAVQRVRNALEQCEQQGLLGNNIFGKFSLQLDIMEGAGAFVCGEETALLASIEGRRGMPTFRPPYPAEKGLWGFPTLVNNCETFATVPWIIRNGADEFSKLGSRKSKGTKVFSLAGKIARGGLIEVPMGITIREIVEDIGGGIQNGKRFKAVQIGGPSGGCVPAELANTPVDYEELTNVGAMMGSGGLLVMDESDCMVDIARYFLAFTFDQSCGKCTYCRIGTKHMLEILERLCSGKGKTGDVELLEELAHKTKQGSLCGLGKTAPNPVLSTIKYFRLEYEAHLQGICPAQKCQALIKYEITDDCIGCTICAQKCPTDAIPLNPYQKHEIIQEKCTKCDTCLQVCPIGAVKKKSSS